MSRKCFVIGEKKRTSLTLIQKLAYGVGHVFNDLAVSMWFTYTLIFFNKVILFRSSLGGIIILIGQIADGVTTPFVGYFSDHGGDFWICRFGRRKTWHLLGTLCVGTSLPFIYMPCIGCEHSDTSVQMVYYSILVIILQAGWAAVQISHLALVPDLSSDQNERTSLLAIRYSFTVISNIIVFLALWIVLLVERDDPNAPITPEDAGKFQYVTLTVLVFGSITSIIFHIGVRETSKKTLVAPGNELNNSNKSSEPSKSTTRSVFRNIRLYQVAVLYLATRLFSNISQTIFPLYLHDFLELGGQSIAVLPMVMYIFSFLMSTLVKTLNKQGGRKMAYCFGAAVGLAVSVWVRLGEGNYYKSYMIYVVAGLYGIASSTLLVTSLAMTSDLIGQDLNQGAFIYGIVSFFDKLSNGAFIMLIQTWTCFPSCEMHYRDSLAYVCGGAVVLGTVAVMSICNTPTIEVEEESRVKHEVSSGHSIRL